MNPHFCDLLDYAQSKNIDASLITNGMLLDEKLIHGFNDNLVNVSLSIDTSSSEKFETIRKGASLSKIMKNMHLLKKLKPNIDITILVVLMKETIEDLPGVVILANEIGATCINVNHIISLDEFTDQRRITSHANKAVHCLMQAEETAKKYHIDFISRPLKPRMRSCWQPWLAPLVMLNGDILPCCFMDRSPHSVCTEWYSGVSIDVPFYQYRTGNIFKESFTKIWNGNAFRQVRKTIRNSHAKGTLTIDEFNMQRKNMKIEKQYSYCRVCLFRWSAAC